MDDDELLTRQIIKDLLDTEAEIVAEGRPALAERLVTAATDLAATLPPTAAEPPDLF